MEGQLAAFDTAAGNEVTELMNGEITIDQYQKTICKVAAPAFE